MPDLFLTSNLTFEKVAAGTTLSEDPNQWSQEVVQELYKQVPYISDFYPHVSMQKADGERGYAIGYITVSNQSEMQNSATPADRASAGIRQVRIPFVVRDGKLMPLDLLVTDNARILPLTESRLRASLFRPQAFDTTSKTPGDQSMIGQLYPPYRQNYGMAGVIMPGGDMAKASSANELTGYEGLVAKVGPKKAKKLLRQQRAVDAFELKTMGKKGSALEEYLEKSAIAGGKSQAEGKDPGDFPSKQVAMGKEVESEHTSDPEVQKRIAADHLAEFPDYYTRLKKMEDEAKKSKEGEAKEEKPGYGRHAARGALYTGAFGAGAGSGGAVAKMHKALKDPELRGHLGKATEAAEDVMRSPEFSKLTRSQRLSARALKLVSKYPRTTTGLVMGTGGALAGAGLGALGGLGTAGVKRLLHKEKTSSVLESILPTINASDLDAFRETIIDQDVRLAYEKNAAATVGAVSMLLKHVPVKLASALDLVEPTIIQLVRVDDGYLLKTASHRAWEPRIYHLDRGEALQQLGSKIVLAADEAGAATVAEGATAEVPEEPLGESAATVNEPGIYKVQTDAGEELVGVVLPSLIDVTGEDVPIALFTNGSQAAVQTDILGTPVAGGDVDLPVGGAPQGYGVFFTKEGGQLVATIPLTVQASISGPEQGEPPVFLAETYDGNRVQVSVQPAIQAVTMSPDGVMLVPDTWQWSPLDKAGEVSLASSEDEVNKQASAMRGFASVEIRSGGNTFSISGPAVEKLASAEKNFLDINDAMFLLAGLGVEQQYGIRKLGEAMAASAPVQVKIGRYLTTAAEQQQQATKLAQACLDRLPSLRRQLFKEAAVISDPDAVDTVLSLGFINPENLTAFVNYLPQLDDTQSRLCELLMAARLGMNDVPEGALERAVRAIEEVIEGLKSIAFQGPSEYN